MVTLQEAIEQRSREIGTFEQQLAQQEQIITGAERKLTTQEKEFLRQTQPLGLPLTRQFSLAQAVGARAVGQTAKQIEARKEEARRLDIPKFERAKREIKVAREQITGERARIQPAKEELVKLEAFERGRKLAEKGFGPIGLGRLERTGFRAGVREEKAAKQRLELLKVGKPLFEIVDKKEVLKGFEVGVPGVRQTIGLEQLPFQQLRQLESIGVIKLEQQKTLTPTFLDTSQLFQPVKVRGNPNGEDRMSIRQTVSPFQVTPRTEVERRLFAEVTPIEKRMTIDERKIEPQTFKEKQVRRVKEFLEKPVEIPLFSIPGARIKVKETRELLEAGEKVPSPVKFAAGFVEETIGTPAQVIKFATPFAFGAGVGVGARGFGALLTRIGPRAVRVGELGLGISGVGLGGLFAVERGREIIGAPTAAERGAIVGVTARELLGFGVGTKVGARGFTTVQDIIRTTGLKEIPAEAVIAPEFFRGQRFPAIRRGQRAGELRREFFEPVPEIGEVGRAPRGFTALPVEPLKEIPKGDSFVFGGFTAPRVSPQFLRVQPGEQRIRLFSFRDFLTGGRPTIARVGVEEVGFAPGITPETPRPIGRPTREQLEFFGGGFEERTGRLIAEFGEPLAPRGRAFIPFVKTEKEAIIPFGTKIEETGRRFFIKFEGRRIPIAELRALPEAPGIQVQPKISEQTLGEFLSSSSRIAESSLVTPTIGGVSFVPSRARDITTFETQISPIRERRPLRDISVISQVPSRRQVPSELISPFGELPSRPSPRRRPEEIIPITPIELLPSIPEREIKRKKIVKEKPIPRRKPKKKVKKVKREKPKVPIRPSLTGIVLGIEAPAIVSPKLGVTPGQIRGLRTGFKEITRTKKRKKSNKK